MTKARDLANAGTALTSVSATELGYLDGVTSAVQTQLNQKPEFAAGKNKIINGDFGINQRNFTSTTTTATYGLDRWSQTIAGDGTATYSAQTFTTGAAPVAGYEGKNFARFVTSGQTSAAVRTNWIQSIESVRTFAGQTATISFWAKAASGTPQMSIELTQYFGAIGSPSSTVIIDAGRVTLSTSWARYSVTVSIPSIAGKTLGTDGSDNLALLLWVSAGSNFASRTGTLGIQNNTFDIWGVQAEAGSVATPFQTATGTIQGELAACQRYYWRLTGASAGYYRLADSAVANSTTDCTLSMANPVVMRVTPTSVDYAGVYLENYVGAGSKAATSLTIKDVSNPQITSANVGVASGLTAGTRYFGFLNNNTSSYLGYSAEL